jgi:hypothetical protein
LYYLFPWVFYFIVLFFKTRRSVFFWIAGIFSVLWVQGALWYHPFFWIFFMSVLCIALFAQDLTDLKALWPRQRRDVAAMIFFFIFAAISLIFCKNSFENLVFFGSAAGCGEFA